MREHVDLPTVDALREEWRLHPPVHHLVAAYLAYKPRDNTVVNAEADVGPLVGLMGDVPIVYGAKAVDTSAFDALQGSNHG